MPEVPDRHELVRWFEEHGELDRLTEVVADRFSRGSIADASRALTDLGEMLEAHFAAEEQVYFPLIERLAGGHPSVVVAAALGHKKIRERLDQLSQLVEGGELAAARRGLDVLLARLRKHEADEARLVRELRALSSSA